MVVDILRAQPGESLTTVLYTPATSAQVFVLLTKLYMHGVAIVDVLKTSGLLGVINLFEYLSTQANDP